MGAKAAITFSCWIVPDHDVAVIKVSEKILHRWF
jgi:hypothetical protein